MKGASKSCSFYSYVQYYEKNTQQSYAQSILFDLYIFLSDFMGLTSVLIYSILKCKLQIVQRISDIFMYAILAEFKSEVPTQK